MKRFIVLAVLLCVAATAMGCETIKGFGKDVENTGQNIWESVGGTG